MADEAAALADDAASIAEVAAAEAAPAAADVSDDMAGGVTMVVVDGAGAGVVVAAGGVTTVSSFLLQAAKETAVASVTISSAVFMFLLGFGFGVCPGRVGILSPRSPRIERHGNVKRFHCLAHDYRRLKGFP